jgi:hypothetical protein
MNTSPKLVWFDKNNLWVALADGRTLGVPLVWFPRLLHATTEQRDDSELSFDGIHWEALDEDISVSGLLAGRGDQMRQKRAMTDRSEIHTHSRNYLAETSAEKTPGKIPSTKSAAALPPQFSVKSKTHASGAATNDAARPGRTVKSRKVND